MKVTDTLGEFDYILVGGGLQSGLIALALNHYRPAASVLLIERDGQLGGNHTWSFHPGDVPRSSHNWIDPIIKHRWPHYQVRINDFSRRVELAYASIPSDHFANVVSDLFVRRPRPVLARDEDGETTSCQDSCWPTMADSMSPGTSFDGGNVALLRPATKAIGAHSRTRLNQDGEWKLMTHTEVINVSKNAVLTSCGKLIKGKLVIDCRGPSARRQIFAGCGYQKFFGFEIELSQDWPQCEPVIMDALPDQQDGFRFIYTLPFTSRRVLVEDTRFSDSMKMDRHECLAQITRYLHVHGIVDFNIVREESGVLPMPFSMELRPEAGSPLAGGYAGGWFHAATGYSFPMAVAFAEAVASAPAEDACDAVNTLVREHLWQSKYSRFLNRLLFRLVTPRRRYRIFRRFYRVLSDRAIERFYSHRFTVGDATRIVLGIPPTVSGLRPLRFIRSFFRGDST